MKIISKNYLAGFFDAEGSVSIGRESLQSVVLYVKVSQNDNKITQELFARLIEQFGGLIHYSITSIGNVHTEYTVRGKRAYILLQYISKECIIKRAQVQLAIVWYKSRLNLSRGPRVYSDEERLKDDTAIEELKALKYTDIISKYSNLDISARYLAGLFDGDGMVGIYRSHKSPALLRVNITQNLVSGVLEIFNTVIRDFGGKITYYTKSATRFYVKLQIYSDSAFLFLSIIEKYVIFKKDQVQLALEWMSNKNPLEGFTDNDALVIKNIALLKTV